MDYKVASISGRYGSTVFWLFLLLMLAKFNIYIGFALKPYMLFCILFFMFHIGSFYFQRLYLFEMGMLIFYLMYSFTGAFSLYPASSARIIFGIILYVSCYFIVKNIIEKFETDAVHSAVANVGIIFNSVSLALYFAGLKSVQFMFEGERVSEFGVMVDRHYPRLIGLVQDPNFFVFYNTIFFCYYLSNFQSSKNKVGLGLTILTNLLTFSRGGLLVVVCLVVLNIFLNNPLKKLKLLLGLTASLAVAGYIAITVMKFDVYSILQSRINDFSEDGGSGRFTLWGRAWEYFNTNILVGIGAFNFSDYNMFENGDPLTAHNTYLDILAESGLIGIVTYLLFLLLVFIKLLNSRIHKKNPYLFLTFLGLVLQMAFLSVIINDMFFMYIAILSAYLHKEYHKKHVHVVKELEIQAGKKDNSLKGAAAYYERVNFNR
ncbi:O-antigen ligase family protein [Mesobacillus sp. S13]|uniref:O-antigen ligase family protein n=1 Tax=Mesobacillus sp. S13 TaxID=2880221 RepID=UPI001CF39EFC|nr:O-antigen ligase family protein [Mesobacillus sp. S13]